MKYNFDEIVDRHGTRCLKWDLFDSKLPMWIADMDFKTAPAVVEALEKRAAHGVFGYTFIDDEWYDAIINWWKTRHHFEIQKDWLIFCTGVVPAISSIVRKLTTPAENVLVQTPVYNMFFNSIVNNGRNVLESPLIYEDGAYHIDFEDLEKQLANPQTSLMILCNPHNPVGKIWDKETLAKIGHLCAKYHVIVVSDEIHCDIVKPGCEYVPFASVSEECRENSVTCIAPTKAFNIAGLQTAAVYASNEAIRHKVWRGLNTDEVAEPNAFAIDAAVAAFTQGGPWLDELCAYLWENRKAAVAFIEKELPMLHPVDANATYLMWLDCTSITTKPGVLAKWIRETTGLFVSAGDDYRQANGFLRINLACPKAQVMEGMKLLKEAITKIQENHLC
jgi:cystathionine beta-lyase